jgi:hypothetical protein
MEMPTDLRVRKLLMEIDREECELEKYEERAKKTATRLNRLETKLEQLQNECPHNKQTEDEGYLVCDRCDFEIGRLCTTSPTHVCEFKEDDPNEIAVCPYCGKPDDVDEDEEDDDDESEDGEEVEV